MSVHRRGALLLVLVVIVAVLAGGQRWAAQLAGAASTPTPPNELATRPDPSPDRSAADEDVLGGGPAAIPAAGPSAGPSTLQPAPTAAPPSATPGPAPAATPEPFAMNLYAKGDYVKQYTFEWCVGASLQMALNMTGPENDTSRARQQALWAMARDRSSSPFGGANPRGWVAALNDLGVGPYELVSLRSFDEALTVAAKAIRETDRPVGLVMWRGRHAWVMSGFSALGDPALGEFTVTGVRVHDPLWPNGSRSWGPSPAPNSLVKPAVLAKQFVIRDRGRVNLGVPPGWLLVLPRPAARA